MIFGNFFKLRKIFIDFIQKFQIIIPTPDDLLKHGCIHKCADSSVLTEAVPGIFLSRTEIGIPGIIDDVAECVQKITFTFDWYAFVFSSEKVTGSAENASCVWHDENTPFFSVY